MILLSLIPFLTPLFPVFILLLSLEFMKFRSYQLKSSVVGPDIFQCVLSGKRGQRGRCLRVFKMVFLVVIVDIEILVMCMTGYLHAILELATPASERKAAPLGGNSSLTGTCWLTWDSPLAWKKGWREAVTSAQHDTPGRALSKGIFTRCFAGWFCPGSKLIPLRGQFNCAHIQPNTLPSAELTAPDSVLHFWGWHVQGPLICAPRAGQCHTSSWNRFRKSCFPLLWIAMFVSWISNYSGFALRWNTVL